MWARTQLNLYQRQFKLVETVSTLVPGVLRAGLARDEYRDLPAIERMGSRFNHRVTAGRHTGCALFKMSEVTQLKRAARRVTYNDIALACVAGALRSYLGHYHALPERSLAAGVPVNLRSGGERDLDGNRTTTMIVGLATHEPDPLKRLHLIHRFAVAGKKQLSALGTGTIMDISDSLVPGVLAEGMKTVARTRRLVDMPVPFHTIVSNVPGPRESIALAGAELLVPFGLGPVRDNLGLFHIVSSSADYFSLAFSACSQLLPDPEHYQAMLVEAFNELRFNVSIDAS